MLTLVCCMYDYSDLQGCVTATTGGKEKAGRGQHCCRSTLIAFVSLVTYVVGTVIYKEGSPVNVF